MFSSNVIYVALQCVLSHFNYETSLNALLKYYGGFAKPSICRDVDVLGLIPQFLISVKVFNQPFYNKSEWGYLFT